MSSATAKKKPKRFVKIPGTPPALKGWLLYLFSFALVPAVVKAMVKGNLLGITVNSAAFGGLLIAAILMRKGLLAEKGYQQKKISKAPDQPLKTLAALIVAVSTMMLAWLGARYPLTVSVAFGLGALLGMYFNYGFDPRKEKTVRGDHGYSTDEIVQTVEEAEAAISSIETAADSIENQQFTRRIDSICGVARSILSILQEDPRDIRRARKFLHVYLDGARKVTEGYAKTHRHSDSQELEANFQSLLSTIENVFREQRDKLLENDILDLDVQIEVLKTQLKREGVL